MIRISMKNYMVVIGALASLLPVAAITVVGFILVKMELSIREFSILIIAVFIGLTISMLILCVSAIKIARRIKLIGMKMQDLSNGDLTTRTGVHSLVTEVQMLADGFNDGLASSLQVIMLGMRELAEENRSLIHELSSGAVRSRESSEEIVNCINAVKEKIEWLDAHIAVTSKSFDEINNSIGVLKNELESQASSINETSASVEQMSASINSVAKITSERNEATGNLLKIVQKGGNQAKTANDIIEEIADGVKEISGMVSVINTVASQTNILSMNASIEAAHAGEYGQGFAVVADEIRKLAESTSNNTKQISTTLKEFVQRIYAARNASTNTGETFLQILTEIEGFVQAFTEISQSTNEVASGSKEMVTGMGLLRESASRIKERSELILTNTHTINEAVGSVHEFSTETRGHIDDVSAEAQRISEDQQSIKDIGLRSDVCIELLMTEMKYFTMETTEISQKDTYDIEEKKIILDHKKRIIGGRALLDGKVDLEHVPDPTGVSACLLTRWIDRSESGNFDLKTVSGLRKIHETFHQRYNEMIAAYRASNIEHAHSLLEEAERNWRGLIDYREFLANVIKAFKSGELDQSHISKN